MGEELATVLRLVAEGKLSPGEAEPIIEALTAHQRRPSARASAAGADATAGSASEFGSETDGRRRKVRIQVQERGRRVVDVRVPLTFAAMATRMVPGIPDSYAALIEQAVEGDTVGSIVDVEDENGGRVLITLE